MKSVLFVSNDNRVQTLVERFQPLLMMKIAVVADFSDGFKEVLEKRPAAVFFQREISGVKAETVANQLRRMLRDDLPRLIYLQETAESAPASLSVFDDKIDLFIDSEQLYRQFKAQLERLPAVKWRINSSSETTTPVTSEYITIDVTGNSGESVQIASIDELPTVEVIVEDVTTVGDFTDVTDFRFDEEIPVTIARTLPAGHNGILHNEEELSADSEPDAVNCASDLMAETADVQSDSELSEERDNQFVIEEDLEQSGQAEQAVFIDSDVPAVIGVGAKSEQNRLSLLRISAIILSIVILGAAPWYILHRIKHRPVSGVVLNNVAATAKSFSADAKLPPFIPTGSLDTAYASSHPGWERYHDSRCEYLVYREKSRIRAFQIIARVGTGIDDRFIARFLQDAVSQSKYEVKKVEEKDGFQLTHGSLAVGGEILVYRDSRNGYVRALVIAL